MNWRREAERLGLLGDAPQELTKRDQRRADLWRRYIDRHLASDVLPGILDIAMTFDIKPNKVAMLLRELPTIAAVYDMRQDITSLPIGKIPKILKELSRATSTLSQYAPSPDKAILDELRAVAQARHDTGSKAHLKDRITYPSYDLATKLAISQVVYAAERWCSNNSASPDLLAAFGIKPLDFGVKAGEQLTGLNLPEVILDWLKLAPVINAFIAGARLHTANEGPADSQKADMLDLTRDPLSRLSNDEKAKSGIASAVKIELAGIVLPLLYEDVTGSECGVTQRGTNFIRLAHIAMGMPEMGHAAAIKNIQRASEQFGEGIIPQFIEFWHIYRDTNMHDKWDAVREWCKLNGDSRAAALAFISTPSNVLKLNRAPTACTFLSQRMFV